MGKRVSNLDSATIINKTDFLLLDGANFAETKKITVGDLDINLFKGSEQVATNERVNSEIARLNNLIQEKKGVPMGGTTGQVLVKKSDTDYDTGWKDDVVVDSVMSDTSENPVQNKVGKKYTDDAIDIHINGGNEDKEYTWIDGYRLATNSVVVNPNGATPSPVWSYVIVPCVKNQVFIVTAKGASAYHTFLFTDKDYKALKVTTNENLIDFETTAPDDGYIICNTSDSKQKKLKSTLFVKGSKEKFLELDDKISEINNILNHPYGKEEDILEYKANDCNRIKTGKQYFVGKGKTFSKIQEAVTQWGNDGYPVATVFISNGEYNEAITVEGKQINFVGESKDGTIIHTTSGNYTDVPLNIRHGTVTIKNLSLISDHSGNPDFDYETGARLKAYGIHIDGGQIGGVVTVENCKIASYQAPAVGTGTIPNSKIRLIDCDCYGFCDYTDDVSSNQYYLLGRGCVLWHTSNPNNYPVRGSETFELINTRIYQKNSYIALKTERSVTSDSMSITAIGNILQNGVKTGQDVVSGIVNPTQNSKWNNVNRLNFVNHT